MLARFPARDLEQPVTKELPRLHVEGAIVSITLGIVNALVG